MGTLRMNKFSRNVRRGSGVLASISYVGFIHRFNLKHPSEFPSSVIGTDDRPSSSKVLMDEQGMTIEVGGKLLFTSSSVRSVLMDRMSIW